MRIRSSAATAAVLVAIAGLGIAFHQRLSDWFSGNDAGGAWSPPARVQAGALTIDTALEPDPPRQSGNRVRVDVADAGGQPIDGADVTVTYDMPAMGAMPEMKSSFPARGGHGRYQAGFDLPMAGSWGLVVEVGAGSAKATARYSLTVGTPGLQALEQDAAPVVTAPATPAIAPASYPPAALAALRRAFDAYDRVGKGLSLAQVDQEGARRLALALHDAEAAVGHAGATTELAAGATDAETIAATHDVAAARAAFADASQHLVAVATADPRLAGDWKLFECAMAPGYQRWFQREPAPTNPYMGHEMAACVSEVAWTAPPPPAPPTPPADAGEIRIDDSRRQTIGVRTAKVVSAPMTLDLRAVGRITYDESRLTDVTTRVGGFVTDLRVATTGRPVRKGEVLFTLYSPELYAAQQEYLVALQARATAGDGLVHASEQKLRLLGLTAAQLASIAARGEPIENVPVVAPASGHVIEKMVVEGDAVEPGMKLFRIAALDTIWVEADLYEADLRQVRPGTAATVSLDYAPGEPRTGKVTFVYPYLDPMTRTGRVRIELPNRGLELKPDMYATVELKVALGERVQVPTAAIIFTGPRRIVFVDLGGGRLRPQPIRIGAESDDVTEVQGGLKAGDMVVTSGNFLVAAESRLRSSTFWQDAP